ncbi:MAG: outer membrane beta-barrel protein, partial [Nitrospira sp.]
SAIGYESLYAKDNMNYTRAWIADYSPYLMIGANAVYPFNDQWTGTVFVVNEYFHLQNSNSLPSYGAQVAYKPSGSWNFNETVYYGPDQSNTSLEFWRSFSDSIVEWKVNDDVTIAGEYQIGTQKNATAPGNPRQFYMGAAFPMRWHIGGPWAVAVRPEFYWDRNGLMTGAEQLVKAVTTTAEYKVPYKWTNMIMRLEYRYDESTGAGGGFFKGNEIAPGVIGLTPAQHMLIFGLIWTLDSP